MQLVQLLYPYLLAGANVAAGLFLYAVFDTVLGGVLLAVGVLVVVAVVHETLREIRLRERIRAVAETDARRLRS